VANQAHLNSIQINPLDFDAADDTRAFVGAKNFSPLPPCFIANLVFFKKFRCNRPVAGADQFLNQ
jgi:hypothetical protein